MAKEQEDKLDPATPTLIVRCGATKRRYRPLTADLVVLGRAPGCDIGLVSPEVSAVHCIISRQGGAWRIRDCSGRGTRVNGRAIQDEPLANGDVIQVGTFSFEAHLPPGPALAETTSPSGTTLAPAERERLQGSRRRFAELALRLRKQLRQARLAEAELARREQDLEEMAQRLRAAHQERPPQREQAEQAGRAQAALENRKAELDHFARHLRRLEQRLHEQAREQVRQMEADRAGYEADLVAARVEVEREQQELAAARAELEQTAALLETELGREREELHQQREELARERLHLDQQWQEVAQIRAELERRQAESGNQPSTRDTIHDSAPPDRLESARRLLRQLAERRQAQAASPPDKPRP